MYDDDSRGLESPDQPHVSIDDWNTRARPDGGEPSAGSKSEPESERDETSDESTHPNDVDPDAASYRLEVIDHQAKRLLEELAADRTDRGRPHEAVRHLREIRAEVEWARRGLCEWPREPSSSAAALSAASDDRLVSVGGADESDESGNSPDGSDDAADGGDGSAENADGPQRSTDDGVPMIVRRGPHVTTVLGPDPAAYERSLEADDGSESTDAAASEADASDADTDGDADLGDDRDPEDGDDRDPEDGDDSEDGSDERSGSEDAETEHPDPYDEGDSEGDRDAE